MKRNCLSKVVTATIGALLSVSANAATPDSPEKSGKLDLSPMVQPIKTDALTADDIITSERYQELYDQFMSNNKFGEEWPLNWCVPTCLGKYKGQPVRIIYNGKTKMSTIFLGLEPKVTLASLAVVDVDSLRNRATLRHGRKEITVDFNDAAAIDGLERRLNRLPSGWKEEGYTYSFDNSQQGMLIQTYVVMYMPENVAFGKEVMNYILSLGIHKEVYDDNEVYDSQRPVNSVKDYVTRKAESSYLSGNQNGESIYKPIVPQQYNRFYSTITDTYEFFPERITDRYLTLNVFQAGTYPVGGGGFEQLVSYTFDRKTGKQMMFDDIFTAGSRAKVNAIYFKAIADQLNDEEKKYADDPSSYEPTYTAENVFGSLSNYDNTDNSIKQSDFKITTPIALGNDGVIFSYDKSVMTDYGEDPIETVVVPYNRLAGLMKIKP